MIIELTPDTVIVFDLDDTLYPEIEFVRSGFKAVADVLRQQGAGRDLFESMCEWRRRGDNAFSLALEEVGSRCPGVTLNTLVDCYRNHLPTISLPEGAKAVIARLQQERIPMGLVTDGRSVTQRNKLRALGIEQVFAEITISEEIGSEKPAAANYQRFVERWPRGEFWMIADNTTKDFIVPDRLGWGMICLQDHGDNIHRQDVTALPEACRVVKSWQEIDFKRA